MFLKACSNIFTFLISRRLWIQLTDGEVNYRLALLSFGFPLNFGSFYFNIFTEKKALNLFPKTQFLLLARCAISPQASPFEFRAEKALLIMFVICLLVLTE
jgi:hypothetical protein